MEKNNYEKLIKKYKDLYNINIDKINNLAQKERYCHVQEFETRASFGFALFLVPFIVEMILFITIAGKNLDPLMFRLVLFGSVFICFFVAEPLFFMRRKKKHPEFNDFIKGKTKSQLFEEKVRLIAEYRYLKSCNKVYLKVIEHYESKIKLINELEGDYTITKKELDNKEDKDRLLKQLEKYEEELKETVKRNIVIEYFQKVLSKDIFQEIILGMMAGMGAMMYWNLPYLVKNTEDNPSYQPPSILSMMMPLFICMLAPIVYNIIVKKYLKRIFIIFNDELKEKIPSKTSYYELYSDGENKREEIKNQICVTLIELDKIT